MSQEVRVAELRSKSQKLVDGPLKHVRAAALAAALVPLASICATPASAQTSCAAFSAGTVCGFVFNDLNHDGIQEAGEPGLDGVPVTITDGTTEVVLYTSSSGFYSAFDFPDGDAVKITTPPPTGYQVSPTPPCDAFSVCNSGTLQSGVSTITTTVTQTSTNFGFFQNTASNPGTGTIGYWKNHPEAWPMSSIMIAGRTYTVSQAIWWFNNIGKDKTTMMFAQLVAAELNVKLGNDGSCINPTIAAADAWLTKNPLGSNLAGSSDAWSGSGHGQVHEQALDAYNNGQLCAPHRQ
jgi:hypothetical protein